jgi:hypothetical protein
MHASKSTIHQNNKLYINCNITVTNGTHKLLGPTLSCLNSSHNILPLLHLAISEALSGSETVNSASFTAFKKTQLVLLTCLNKCGF